MGNSALLIIIPGADSTVKSGSGLSRRPDNLGGGVTGERYWLFSGQEHAEGALERRFWL